MSILSAVSQAGAATVAKLVDDDRFEIVSDLSISMGPVSFVVRVDSGCVVARDGSCDEVSSDCAVTASEAGVVSESKWGSWEAESLLTVTAANTVVPMAEVVSVF